jgi:dolichol-phosphate mannosyltransferase
MATEEGSPARALVIVPTYNEIGSIGEVVGRLFEAAGGTVDLLVVDDGSPDGTAALVEAMAAERPQIHLLRRDGKLGLGTAYVTGFRWAMERGYDAVIEMDADLSHDPADVPRLLAALGEAELAIGSRYVPGGSTRNWGPGRRALSKMGNLYAAFWLRFGVRDSTSGFRAYRTAALGELELGSVGSEGYAFQIEMTHRVRRSGGRIVEVPIVFVERETGASKMSRRIVLEALVKVPRWGLTQRRGRGT